MELFIASVIPTISEKVSIHHSQEKFLQQGNATPHRIL